MDVTPFWQPFQNVMAMQRATADRRYDMAQNNVLMDMKRQEFDLMQQQNALAAAKQQAELDQAMREQQMREELASMFTPQQTGGPLMDNGGSYQHLSQTSGQPTQAQLLPLLARMGKTTEVFNALAPREMAIVDGNYVDKYGGGARQIEGFTPTSKYSPEYQAFLDANFDGKNSAEASAAFEQREIARRSAGATRVSNTSIVNTKGQDKVDTSYAPEYVKNIVQGGIGDMYSQIDALSTVRDRLFKDNKLSGRRYAAIPENLLPVVAPDVVEARDMVLETVQRGLKAILGTQFTEEEGKMFMRRAYDVRLPTATNARKVDRILRQLEVMAEATADSARYFEKHGTLTGYRGRVYTKQDFLGDRVPVRTPQRGARPQQGNDLSRAAQEELRRRGIQ